MKRVLRWVLAHWQICFVGLLIFSFYLFLYTFQLNRLTGGFSKLEHSFITATSSFSEIIKQPVFLPHKILVFTAQQISNSASFVRLPSVLLMLTMICCFYVLVERWYTRRIAMLATLLFASSSWTLIIGRQALPTVMYLAWLPVLALMFWTLDKSKNALALILWSLSIGIAMYIPGLLWFVIVLGISQRKRLSGLLVSVKSWQVVLSLLVLVILVAPFLFSLIDQPLTALQSLGFPATIDQITSFPKRILQLVAQIFVYSSANPVFHLGHLPYLDITTTILFLCGLYRLRYSKARKLMGWSGIVTVGWIAGVGFGAINIAIFLPLIYFFVAGGISFLLVQWFKVFPKNPFARGLGSVIMTCLVLLLSFYHLSRYFIAWPMNPSTRAAFSFTDVKIDK